MCLEERNTERRGRLLPARRKLRLTRSRRRKKRALALSDIRLLLLAFLAADRLGRVFDALALVGFRRAIGADLGRDLADPLAVGAGDIDQGRPFTDDLDVVGDRIRNLVTVAELQIERVALHRGAVADAIDFQGDRKAFRYSGDHIVHQRPGRTPHRSRMLRVVLWRDRDRTLCYRSGNLVADDEAQRAETALGAQSLPRHLHLDTARYRDRMLANT